MRIITIALILAASTLFAQDHRTHYPMQITHFGLEKIFGIEFEDSDYISLSVWRSERFYYASGMLMLKLDVGKKVTCFLYGSMTYDQEKNFDCVGGKVIGQFNLIKTEKDSYPGFEELCLAEIKFFIKGIEQEKTLTFPFLWKGMNLKK